jgi:hypothetical protein
LGFFRLLWWVDPDGGRDFGWFWWLADKALWRGQVGGIQRSLSRSIDRFRLSEVELVRRHQTYAGVMMILIVPCEEPAAKRAGLFYGFKVLWELGLIFQSFEMGFRERVIV